MIIMCESLYVLQLRFICTYYKGKPAASIGNPLKQLTAWSHPHIHSCFTINGLTQCHTYTYATFPYETSIRVSAYRSFCILNLFLKCTERVYSHCIAPGQIVMTLIFWCGNYAWSKHSVSTDLFRDMQY